MALAPSIRNVRLAHYFFAVSGIWSYGCTMQWLAHLEITIKSYVLAFAIGGTILALWLASYKWVEANYREQSGATMNSPSNTTTQGPNGGNMPASGQSPPTSVPRETHRRPQASQDQTATGSGNVQQQQRNTGGTNYQQNTSGAYSPILNNPVINVTQTELGNLRERAIQLSDDMMEDLWSHGWFGWENHVYGFKPPPVPKDPEQGRAWRHSRYQYFIFRFFAQVKSVRDELAQIHLRSPKLDRNLDMMDQTDIQNKKLMSQGVNQYIDLPLDMIDEASQQLRALAEKIPNTK